MRFGLLPKKCCCKGRCPRRRATASLRPDKHPDSESEFEEAGSCKAECIGWRDRRTGKVMVLSKGPCNDAAVSKPIDLLKDDALVSDTRGLASVNGRTQVHLCRGHANHYLVARQNDRCSFEGCDRIWVKAHDGVKRCERHPLNTSIPTLADVQMEPDVRPGTEASATRRPTQKGASGKQPTCYEVWIPVQQSERPMVKYFRFMGTATNQQGDGDNLTVFVPTLARTIDVPTYSLGPWAVEARQLLEKMLSPAIVAPWYKPVEDLERIEGTADDGTSLHPTLLAKLLQGERIKPSQSVPNC